MPSTNRAVEAEEPYPARFSFGWCATTTFLHFVATIALAGMNFVAGMGAFTASTEEAQHFGGNMAVMRMVDWIWTPLAMAAINPDQDLAYLDTGSLFVLALIWSCIVGVVAGLFFPTLYGWLRSVLRSPVRLSY